MSKVTHAFTSDVMGDLDGVALAELIRKKEMSSSEVVEASIKRAMLVEPVINSIVCESYEKARIDAKNPAPGFFSGLPMFYKDMVDVAGMKTIYGSEAFETTAVKKKNDKMVNQFLAQGFVTVGKSTMPEIGFTCSTEFPKHYRPDTRNPWNSDHSAGGSSGGAAALVAAGVLPIAHTADGGGSTRIPSACCGLVGLKATNGRIHYGAISGSAPSKISMEGVTTRSVRDTAYFYAEAEKYYKNPKLPPIGLVVAPGKRRLTIAVIQESLSDRKADEVSVRELEKTITLLESLGHTVKRIKPPVPAQFESDFIDTWKFGAYLLKKFGHIAAPGLDRSKFSNLTNYLAEEITFKKVMSRPLVAHRMAGYRAQFDKEFEIGKFDLLLSPTLAHPAIKLGEMGMDLPGKEVFERMRKWAIFSPYSNGTGAPSITLPLGHDEVNNLPVGMLFWSKFGDEKILFEISYELELASPWRKINA